MPRTLRRTLALLLFTLIAGAVYAGVVVVQAGFELNDRISRCSDSSHPMFILDDAERLRVRGHL